MNIIGKKNLFFALSLAVIIPGMISLMLWGLNVSIDFTGGSRMTYLMNPVNEQKLTVLKSLYASFKDPIVTTQLSGQSVIVRTAPIDQKKHNQISAEIKKQIPDAREEAFETIGPTVGSETTINALKGILLASLLIVFYIAYTFREVPKPASSWRFGICAIVALLHDVLVVVGIFSILGHFLHVEVDSLFVTALLTVIGFSVHDTIVVFDRIRENLRRSRGEFSVIVNESILQTLGRSLNTSLTVILVLLSLLFFSGESTRWFIVALLVGIVSGTFSSIFNASPLLVLWHEISEKKKVQ